MKLLRPSSLLGRLLGILVLVVAADFILNAIVFERANEFSLQEEDASRMSDQLVVAYRMLDQSPIDMRGEVAEELCTERFTVNWAPQASRQATSIELDRLREQILEREPDLNRTGLRLHLQALSDGGDVGGSMILSDRSIVSFSADVNEAWHFNAQRVLILIMPTVLLVLVGALLVRAALQPLNKLLEATRKVGSDEPSPISVSGTHEVRALLNAFNVMQDRIHQLIRNRQLTVSAIAHDLRTPLTRLQMRLENDPGDKDNRDAMAADIVEMRLLLESLQTFNEGLDHTGKIERVDIASMAETLIDDACDRGHDARYDGPTHLVMQGRALSLRRVLSNLVENALHYAGNVRLTIHSQPDEVVITVEDDGPGIDEESLEEVLQPFVRLDEARSRDTPGMGLGLAIVDQIVRGEGGCFELSNRAEGGLRAVVRLPVAAKN
ncbi:signal transduction histidine kinase [Altererythrobacter atlanticus]|uniref:histidine kinase n=1 Tax=Croceibacterium atlanticum TaxID=1267766 RepID=A0A0F7KY28_9SPHN|nr:ATP-binding protein [Croceibacterium atlanticum]AKH44122.1 Osmolarity sensor protein EnvZ [Croceibacterium atlanticum]MBB5732432.1 signal transduction histidine kinase [Croceibacterium atlanticum]